jgi:DNA-binding transcriptional regulator YdaS (Cro superfamily)
MIDIVERAAEKAGGVVALARELGIKHTAMYSWNRVPAERVLDIERVTGISRHDLRPDIFGPTPQPEGVAQ